MALFSLFTYYFLECFDGQSVTAFYSYDTTITSPFYPSDYYSDVECTWRVTVDNALSSGGYVVKVTFADFELQPYTYEHCHDGLEFYDGHNNTGSNLLGLYCGKAHPEVIYSTGQDLYVRFYTDRYLNYFKGFSVGISAVKEGTVMIISNYVVFIITNLWYNIPR